MRRLIVAAIAILLILSVPVAISLQVPRQVDPSSAPEDQVYGQGLYLFYGSIIAAVTGGNYTAARQLLHGAGLIHVPPEIIDAFNSFNGLVNSTANEFRAINAELANASTYVSTGRLAQAKVSLQGAITNLRAANGTLSQLFGAEPQLASLTGIPSSLLMQKLDPLESAYTAYSAEAGRLLKILTGLTRLEQPSLTLSVAPATILTGANVSVRGTLLTQSGVPLASRNVTIYFVNGALGTAKTDDAGNYSAELATPYFYQKSASMFASFLPSGNDTLTYASATTAPAYINVTFATPSVSISVPPKVLAGQPLRVNGSLTLGGSPLAGYNVSLSGFSGQVRARAADNGSFSLYAVPPASLAAGSYPLILETEPSRQVGPIVETTNVYVIKVDPNVSSNVPMVAIAGFPVTFSGLVDVNGSGLSGARVLNVSPSPAVDTSTNSEGNFTITVTPSLSTPNGDWAYSFEVYPSQSWISASPVTLTVFIINPLVLLFPASSLGLLAFVVRRRRSPAKGRFVLPEKTQAPPRAPEHPPLAGLPAAYARAVQLMERATSVILQPQMTIREYLVLVKGRAKGYEHFDSISSALESQLYGPGGYKEVDSWAVAELEALRRDLEG